MIGASHLNFFIKAAGGFTEFDAMSALENWLEKRPPPVKFFACHGFLAEGRIYWGDFQFRRNFTVTVRCIATACPSKRAGAYFHWRTVSIAACCNIEGPESTFAVLTLPFASISASTTTSPLTCVVLAIAG